eukprot:TRINITY_DN12919_c0_g1_i1.p1 TRINITY_DN12919_c0_g1~~TRINITY_DN12919_c0_g1_i1.p1  ORF type:complete len:469 (-),score=88.71 TRINITY_DN12919_c0_g1_i1:27-1391(-)
MKTIQPTYSLLLLVLLSIITVNSIPPPLILTDYLHTPHIGRELSQVHLEGMPVSYSGYFNVDKEKNSNSFFWFFPAQNDPENAPVLLWLQGGPGSSSLYGLFAENGPFSVSSDLKLVPRSSSWNRKYSLLYIDNPIGVGFSWTDSAEGYVTNEQEVGMDLYETLYQFFTIFDNYRSNDFYVTGESYGGKYVPACAYTIHEQNKNQTKHKINLKGIAIGDGLLEAETQFIGMGALGYHLSLLDMNERKKVDEYEKQFILAIKNQDYVGAFKVIDELINGDFYPYPTFFYNATGSGDYFNIMDTDYPNNPYSKFITQDSVRTQLHVGDIKYWGYNRTVEEHLIRDWLVTTRPQLEVLINNYKVLIYNGQNDLILGPPLCENFLRTLNWDHQSEYLNAKKIIWKIKETDRYVAGFAREVGNFRQVIVRDAGHMVPLDQPERALDMIERFVDGRSFQN